MKVTALINNVSRVARMVELSEGDIYKRIKERTDSYGGGAKIYFGRVMSIVATDESSAIEVFEFATSWDGEDPVKRVFSSDEDLHITSCSLEEFSTELSTILSKMQRNIDIEETKLENNLRIYAYAKKTLGDVGGKVIEEKRAYVEA